MITIFGMIIFGLCSFYEPDWHFDWQGIRPEVKNTVLEVKDRGVDHIYSGEAGGISTQYKKQQWLLKYATADELQKLTAYPDGTVKVIAYEGLLKDPSVKDKASIVLNVINDTVTKVYYTIGCIGDRTDVSEYVMRHTVFNNLIYSSGAREIREGFKFTDSQKKKILSEYYKIHDITIEN